MIAINAIFAHKLYHCCMLSLDTKVHLKRNTTIWVYIIVFCKIQAIFVNTGESTIAFVTIEGCFVILVKSHLARLH